MNLTPLGLGSHSHASPAGFIDPGGAFAASTHNHTDGTAAHDNSDTADPSLTMGHGH